MDRFGAQTLMATLDKVQPLWISLESSLILWEPDCQNGKSLSILHWKSGFRTHSSWCFNMRQTWWDGSCTDSYWLWRNQNLYGIMATQATRETPWVCTQYHPEYKCGSKAVCIENKKDIDHIPVLRLRSNRWTNLMCLSCQSGCTI